MDWLVTQELERVWAKIDTIKAQNRNLVRHIMQTTQELKRMKDDRFKAGIALESLTFRYDCLLTALRCIDGHLESGAISLARRAVADTLAEFGK